MRSNSLHDTAPSSTTPRTIAAAVATTTATLILGCLAFGLVTMLVFTAGFAGGPQLWLLLPNRGNWTDIKIPYWTALVLFLAHRVEEKQMGFFAYLSTTTGLPTPAITSASVVLLLVVSVGAWLLIPVLMTKTPDFGRYLARTFFASLGITELAHYLVFESPWKWWRLPTLETGMESCRRNSRRADRRHAVTALPRRPPRCGWSGPCAKSWAASTERSSGSPTGSATGSSRSACGCARPTSTTATPPGVSTVEARRIKELEQENRELKRANAILKRAASFFGAELDRQHKK